MERAHDVLLKGADGGGGARGGGGGGGVEGGREGLGGEGGEGGSSGGGSGGGGSGGRGGVCVCVLGGEVYRDWRFLWRTRVAVVLAVRRMLFLVKVYL
jgi:hypothetical protein